jgi:sugar phosphate isomerase/epimerase
VWQLVQKADRPNIGLCLDTFQTAGSEWADPTTKSGLIEALSLEALEKGFHSSLRDLSATVPKDKIYFLQVSDAYKMDPALSPEPDESGLRPRGRWSHDYRPLPFDGGYLPIVEVTKAVLGTGFRGWFSIEIFDGQLPKKHGDDMAAFAKKATAAHHKLLKEAGAE